MKHVINTIHYKINIAYNLKRDMIKHNDKSIKNPIPF